MVLQIKEIVQTSSAFQPEVDLMLRELTTSVSNAVDLAVQVRLSFLHVDKLSDLVSACAKNWSARFHPAEYQGAPSLVRHRLVPTQCHRPICFCRFKRAPVGPDCNVCFKTRGRFEWDIIEDQRSRKGRENSLL